VVPSLAGAGISALAFSTVVAPGRLIAAATEQGVAISEDAGWTWRSTGRELGPILSLAFVPGDEAEALLAGLPHQGVARSDDQGSTWALANDGLGASLLVALAISPAFDQDQTLFAAGLQEGVSV